MVDFLKSMKPKKKSNSKDNAKSKKTHPDRSTRKKKEKKQQQSTKSKRVGKNSARSGRSQKGKTKSARNVISAKMKSVTSKKSKDPNQKSRKEQRSMKEIKNQSAIPATLFDINTFTFKIEKCVSPEPSNHSPAQNLAFESFAGNVLAMGVDGLVKEYVEVLYPFIPILERTIFDQNTELKKNRYKDVICNDKTRVILNDGRPGDYIHANYVKGVKPLYILTQGPMKESMMDMWRMVLQEGVAAICMLCELVENGRPKCEPYFPDGEGQELTFDDIVVTCTEYTTPDVHTQLKALTVTDKKTGKTHKLSHYKIVTWPDKTIPLSNLSILRTHRILRKLDGPIVVHCSAGVGRTGTFAAIEVGAQCLLNGRNVKPVDLVKAMRHCRLHSVQMDTQYLMLVEALLDMGVAFKYIEDRKLLDAVEVYKKKVAEYVEAHPPPKEPFKPKKEKEKQNEDVPPPVEPINPDPTHTLYPITSSPIGPPSADPPPITPMGTMTPIKAVAKPAITPAPTSPPPPPQNYGKSMHVSPYQQSPPVKNPGNSTYL